MNAYIDLTPVRAVLVQAPMDYRWSSYAEAVAGGRKASSALDTLTKKHRAHETPQPGGPKRQLSAAKVLSNYRVWLFDQGEEVRDDEGPESEIVRKGIKRETVEGVRNDEGILTITETPRHRVTYFTAGVVLGRRAIVNSFFEARRDQFDSRRKQGARPMKGGSFADLCTFRAPRAGVV